MHCRSYFAYVGNGVRSAKDLLPIYRRRDCVELALGHLLTDLEFDAAGIEHDDLLNGRLIVGMIARTMLARLSAEMEEKKTNDGKKDVRLYNEYSLKTLLRELSGIGSAKAGGDREDNDSSILAQKSLLLLARVRDADSISV